jgi:hypothetical protein
MSGKMTLKKLEGWILEGRGVGTRDNYLPWIHPGKRDTSDRSNQSHVPMPTLTRHCDFLSRAERHTAHLCWWVGVEDVREQYPLWPWPHEHPLQEVIVDQRWPEMPGMAEIARSAGIRLYNYVGLPIPTVLSIDLFVTIPEHRERNKTIVGISCKPAVKLATAEACDRVRVRLELDRLYCRTAELSHLLMHAESLPRPFVKNLEWLAPLQPLTAISTLAASSEYRLFVERVRRTAYVKAANDAAAEASQGLNWSPGYAQFAMRTAMWRLDVDVDLLRPVSMASPLRPGGRALRSVVRQRLFGAMAWD